MVQKTIGYGLYFDGDDYVKVDHYDALNISDVITVACWFKLDESNTTQSMNRLVYKNGAWSLFFFTPTGRLGVEFWNPDGNRYFAEIGWTPDGKWHHIAGTYDGSVLRFYLDGEEKATKDVSTSIKTNTNPVYIGQYCIGAISFVAVYQKALTAEEIRRSYISGRLYHPTSPKLLLEIDEGRGNTVYNRHYSYNDGSIVGAVWTEGHTVDRGCVYFDGSGGRCPLYERGRNIDSEGVTVLVTLKWKETSSSEQDPVIKYSCYAFYIPANTDKMRWGVYSSSYGGWRYLEIDKFPRNTWTTLAGVYDKQNGILRLYKDGILMSEQTGIETDVSSTNDVCLGRYFKGWIRDVKIYDRVLSSSEIKYLSSTLYPKNKSKLRWWINFEQEGGHRISSLTGRGLGFFYDNSYCSSPASPIAETIEGCLDFDGVDDYVNAPNNSNLLPEDGSWSIEAWIKGTWSGSHYDRFYDFRPINGVADRYCYAGADGVNGKLRVRFDDGSNVAVTTFSDVEWLDGNWHHIVIVLDRSDNKVKAYLDGKKSSTEMDVSSVGAINTCDNFYLATTGSTDWLNGAIDEVRIYKKALTQEEIIYSYLYRAPKDKTDLVLWYKFDERAGTTVIDYSGNGNDGTIYGARWKSYVRRLEVEEIKTEENVNFPSRVEIVSDHLEEPVVNRSIIVKRDSIDPVFTGVIEQIEKEEEGYSKRSRIIARDFSSLLEKKLTGSISYVDQKVEDIVSDLLDRNYCLQFDGDDYIQATFSATSLSSFTFEVWAKPRGEGWLARLEESNYLAGSYLNAWGFNFWLYDKVNSTTLRHTHDYWKIQDNRWHHFVATYDGEYLVTYKDGEITSSDYYSGFSFSPDTFSSGNYFRGDICLIRLYSRALSPDEVKDRYINNTDIRDGLFIEYKFTEGSGSTLTDTSGNGYNASITGAVWSHHGVIGEVMIQQTPDIAYVYNEWLQTTDEDFNGNTLSHVEVEGTGADAKVNLKDEDTDQQSTSGTDELGYQIYDGYQLAQSFQLSTSGYILKAIVKLSRTSYHPPNPLTVAIRESLTGSNIISKSLESGEVPTTEDWFTIEFDTGDLNYLFQANTTYYLVFYTSEGDSSHYYYVCYWLTGEYPNGNKYTSDDGGSTWSSQSAHDIAFKIVIFPTYGEMIATISPPYHLSWDKLDASVSLNGQTLKFDILDSADNVLISDITPSQLPYDISSISVSSIKLKAKFETSQKNVSPDLLNWDVTYYNNALNLEVDYETLSDALKRIGDLASLEIYFDSKGLLAFTTGRGVRKDLTLTITEGEDCDMIEHSETLPLVNKWKVIGATIGNERIEAEYSDTTSINLYGERSSVYIDNRLETRSSALNMAEKLVRKHKDPTYKRTVKELDEKAERIEAGDYIYLDSDDLSLKGGYRVERVRRTIDDSGELADLEITAKAKRIGEKIREIDEIRGWFK